MQLLVAFCAAMHSCAGSALISFCEHQIYVSVSLRNNYCYNDNLSSLKGWVYPKFGCSCWEMKRDRKANRPGTEPKAVLTVFFLNTVTGLVSRVWSITIQIQKMTESQNYVFIELPVFHRNVVVDYFYASIDVVVRVSHQRYGPWQAV